MTDMPHPTIGDNLHLQGAQTRKRWGRGQRPWLTKSVLTGSRLNVPVLLNKALSGGWQASGRGTRE